MASGQALSDGALYLYRCISNSSCAIDWNVVGAALDLKPGTASKRYSRLGQRIEKNNATLSGKWSGNLDADGEFLLQCITSGKCQIDFNNVGSDCNLKPATASKRYSRLLAKYKSSSQDSADEVATATATATIPTPATAVIQTPASNSKSSSKKKRSNVLKDEPYFDEETPTKKRKTTADSDGAAQDARFKREDEAEVKIPSMDGPSDSPPEKRQTRGMKVDYTLPVISDSEDDEKSDSDGYDQVEPQSDADDYMVEDSFEGKTIFLRRGQTNVQAARKPVAVDGPVSKLPPNVPIGLAGMPMWQAGALDGQRASKTYMPRAPIQLTSIIPAAGIDDDGYETAPEMGLPARVPFSEVQTAHAVQLKTELDMASASNLVAGEDDSEDEQIMLSIEDAKQQSRGFLTRFLPWWK